MKEDKEITIPFQHTQYGFTYGAAWIERTFSNKKDGSVTLTLKTPKGDLQIYVTKTGKVRIFDYHGSGVEWKGTLTKMPKENKS